MSVDPKTSQRIHILRSLLILGIVWLHIPPSLTIPSTVEIASEPLLWLKLFSEKTLFRASVPTLSIISGYLFYIRPRSLRDNLKNKTKSLVWPFILWNVPLVLLVWWLQSSWSLGHSFSLQLHPFNTSVWADAAFALHANPLNFPLGFLRDLFVCALLSPVIYACLVHARWVGVLFLIALVIGLVPQSLLLRPTILLGFYLGGWLAVYKSRLTLIDRYPWFWIGGFAVACIWVTCIAFKEMHDMTSQGLGHRINMLRILGMPAFWALSGVLFKTRLGELLAHYSPHTFFLFCIHGPLLVASWIFWQATVGDVGAASYVIYFLMACPVTVFLAWSIEGLMLNFFPALYDLCTGQRHPRHAKTPVLSNR